MSPSPGTSRFGVDNVPTPKSLTCTSRNVSTPACIVCASDRSAQHALVSTHTPTPRRRGEVDRVVEVVQEPDVDAQ